MTSKRKRKRKIRRQPTQHLKSRPSGTMMIAMWIVTIVLIGLTILSIRSDLQKFGHSHVSLIWIYLQIGTTVVAIVYTLRWWHDGRRDGR